MRASLIMALAGLGLGVGFCQVAAAGGWDDIYCRGGTVFFYHVPAPGPHHANVVHYPMLMGVAGRSIALRPAT